MNTIRIIMITLNQEARNNLKLPIRTLCVITG